MSYLKSESSTSTPPPVFPPHAVSPSMRPTVQHAKPTAYGGGVMGWRLSRERQPRSLQRHGT